MKEILLDKRAFKVLYALQNNPVGSIQDFVRDTNLSHQTITLKLEIMKRDGFLKGIRAELNLKALELELIEVIVDTPTARATKILEYFMEIHHYSVFCAKIFGKNSGLYLHFRIPIKAKKHLKASLNEFQMLGIVKRYNIIESVFQPVRTLPRIDSWQQQSSSWKFNWSSWQNNNKFSGLLNSKDYSSNPSIVDSIDQLDAYLLHWLTKDARSNQASIVKHIKDNGFGDWKANRVSGRWNYLKNSAISGYELNLDWQFLNLYNSILLSVTCKKGITEWVYAQLLNSNTCPPFSTKLVPTDLGFNWLLRIPSDHINHILMILWDKVDTINSNVLDLSSSKYYSFDYTAFLNDEWNIREQFVHLHPFHETMSKFRIDPRDERLKQIFK